LLEYSAVPVNILLSFTGFHDPYTKTAVAGEEQRGPILTALTAHEFDRVILFGTPRTLALTDATAEALKTIAPEVTVEVIALPLQDPTDYTQIIVNLRTRCGEIIERFPTARLYVSTASGTPQMHACWLLLAASGELPARLLHTRPPQFVSDEKPMVSEVDVIGTPFPRVVPAASGIDFDTPAFQQGPNLNDVLEEIGIVAEHPRMRFALETARNCAEYDCPVLITGRRGLVRIYSRS
jgi:sigma54-dependent transcription regulator